MIGKRKNYACREFLIIVLLKTDRAVWFSRIERWYIKGRGPIGFVKISARWSAVGWSILLTPSWTACLLACSNMSMCRERRCIVGDSARFFCAHIILVERCGVFLGVSYSSKDVPEPHYCFYAVSHSHVFCLTWS